MLYFLHLFLHVRDTSLVLFIFLSFHECNSSLQNRRSASRLINSRRFKHAVQHEIRISRIPGVFQGFAFFSFLSYKLIVVRKQRMPISCTRNLTEVSRRISRIRSSDCRKNLTIVHEKRLSSFTHCLKSKVDIYTYLHTYPKYN